MRQKIIAIAFKFSHKMGVLDLGTASLPAYPYGIDQSLWPKDTSNPENPVTYIRFRWDKTEKDRWNRNAIKEIAQYIRAQTDGRFRTEKAKLVLLGPDDLHGKLVQKYMYMR